MTAAAQTHLTELEYLAFERDAETKHELVNGEIVAMSGGSPRHNVIAANIIGELRGRLKELNCRPTTSDQRVRIPDTGLYTYPDVTVICGPPKFSSNDANTICNPTVIFEILSPKTEAYDRGAKFDHYRRCSSLVEYVLVSQHERLIEHYRRTDIGQWVLTVYRGDGEVELPTLGCTLPIDEVYLDADAYSFAAR